MKKKVAIIGFTGNAKIYYNELRRSENFELVGIFDGVQNHEICTRIPFFNNINDLLSSVKIDAIIVTDTHKHLNLIPKCLNFIKFIMLDPWICKSGEIRELKYWEQRLSGELDNAINDNQLKVYLQEQCDGDGKVIGAEALIRWIHPTEGLMPPYRFIPMFEKNGLISKVDLFVWKEAAKLLKKWQNEGNGDYYISVNISPADFYFLDIYKELVRIVEKYEINPAKLKLEITETLIMKDVESRLMIVEKLRDFGFTVEMDDFGSGYSSLNMLKDISVDVLKLDMGFLYKTKDEEKSRKIIEMIVQLSKALDMPVICEGVETKSQFEFLKNIKCDYFQGYLFAKPVSIEDFENKNL